MFRFGISFGRNDLNLEGHLQMGYNSKTLKNYSSIENHTKDLKANDCETIIPPELKDDASVT